MNIVDKHGRKIRKLRVSLLDACNFRCFYCMPLRPNFVDRAKLLQPEEIERICELLIASGIEQIRITGGEPSLRSEFRDIVARLARLPIAKLGLTSNGFILRQHLEFLKEQRCTNLNISLDSLVRERFNAITRSKAFDEVMQTVLSAREQGFNLKINVVLIRGRNSDELFDFVEFSARHEIEVRFLEVMKIGQVIDKHDKLFVPASEAIKNISQRYELMPLKAKELDATSFNFATKGGANLGFIASESRPFCGSCSRWRLSATGKLRVCLMSQKGLELKGVDRSRLNDMLKELLAMKPITRLEEIKQNMHQIGG